MRAQTRKPKKPSPRILHIAYRATTLSASNARRPPRGLPGPHAASRETSLQMGATGQANCRAALTPSATAGHLLNIYQR